MIALNFNHIFCKFRSLNNKVQSQASLATPVNPMNNVILAARVLSHNIQFSCIQPAWPGCPPALCRDSQLVNHQQHQNVLKRSTFQLDYFLDYFTVLPLQLAWPAPPDAIQPASQPAHQPAHHQVMLGPSWPPSCNKTGTFHQIRKTYSARHSEKCGNAFNLR